MLATQRSHHPRHPPISYPLSAESPPLDDFSKSSPMSPKSAHHLRRPSIVSPMSWLSRSSSSASQHAPYTAAAKPVRISEPKLTPTLETLASARSGALGTGALVVRTPQEALAGSGVSVEAISDPELQEEDSEESDTDQEGGGFQAGDLHLASPPGSPPRPSLSMSKSSPTLLLKESTQPAKPTRPPPPAPVSSEPSTRSSLKRSPSLPISSQFPQVPPLPAHLTLSPPPPPFECILLSSVPTIAIDMSKIIVTLETCTATHRTTLTTLTSRPSHLADYLKSLFRWRHDSTASLQSQASDSMGSPDSSFNSVFHHHLTSSGLLPQSATNIHVFLDRPSSPYDHILAYLRSPPATIDHVPALPHAVQLHTTTTARIEALVALRDEARYLGLDDLHKLCIDELRTRQTHLRGGSSGSVRSAPTVREAGSQRSSHAGEQDSARDSAGSVSGLAQSNSAHRTSPSDLAASLQQRLSDRERRSGEMKREGADSLWSRPTGNWL
ncbi:hypothetical protein EW146_g1397 [Bondarzewia mesenterica]|uniref:BTB domain-containing protein n=1 Tax=Bondarzewia mesenterica TaxID=1095465 RepID=A0A4S4M5H4_9AGAM|nr:hypothetical protein EW146_g1397 [Bondarzewia mesenterica]